MLLPEKHILFTVNTAWNLVTFRKPLIAALLEDGHKVSALVPFDDAVPELRWMGVHLVDLKIDSQGMSPLKDFQLMRRMRRHFAELKPDIVFGYTIKNNLFGAMAAKGLGIPFVPNVTGLGTAFLGGSVLRSIAHGLYRRAFRGLPRVFFQNADDRALFLKAGLVKEDQTRLLPGSGVDLTAFEANALPENQTFLQIGRLLREKGVEEFVGAARLLRKDWPSARFQLLGGLSFGNRSLIDMAQVQAWVNEGVIEYLGEVGDIRPYVAASDAVVLASYREGLPRSLLEGAAMGRPLIATDVPGCRDVVVDGKNGFLCAEKSAESLADAMQRFMTLDAQTRAQMGQTSRLLVEERFDVGEVIHAYRRAISAFTS